jgi:molecular chaperone HscB
MQLEEMRASRNSGEADAQLEASLTQAKEKYHVLLEAVDDDLRVEWDVWDEGDNVQRSSAQKRMVALLDRRRYLSNLVRDVNEVLGV